MSRLLPAVRSGGMLSSRHVSVGAPGSCHIQQPAFSWPISSTVHHGARTITTHRLAPRLASLGQHYVPRFSGHRPTPRLSGSSSARLARYSSAAAGALRHTALYDLHKSHGAKMVPFGGYSMPLQYAGQGISESHHWTRNHASLFDVSHMVQHLFSGGGVPKFLEKITPASVGDMEIGTSKLSTFLHPETGGIVDDTVITRHKEDEWHVVTNATTREKVLGYLSEQPGFQDGFTWEVYDRSLLALQGPASEEALLAILSEHRGLLFGQCVMARPNQDIADILGGEHVLMVSRGGYTGEDGFEIGMPHDIAPLVAEKLLENPEVKLAGLGARDSLRLEAGMCLYGHDLDDTTTPVEAGLSWIIPKMRRETGGFYGAERILGQLNPKSKGGLGVERRRVGLTVQGVPAREGATILAKDSGQEIGVVTSGCPSPTVGENIAMGYVKDGFHKAGTEVVVQVRGKGRGATVTKMPFVATRYKKA